MGKSLIIGNADFSSVAVEKVKIDKDAESAVAQELAAAILLKKAQTGAIGYGHGYKKLITTNYRATVVIPVADAIEEAPFYQNGFSGIYTSICVPTNGLTKITSVHTNSAYRSSLCLWWAEDVAGFDSGWKNANEECEIVIATFFENLGISVPEYIWVSANFKIGAAGETQFTDETFESIGWSIDIDFG